MRIGLPKKNSLNLKLMISRRTCRSGFGLAYLGLIALYFMGQCVNKHGTTYSIAEFCIRICERVGGYCAAGSPIISVLDWTFCMLTFLYMAALRPI